MITTRPATTADIMNIYGQLPGQTVRADVFEVDGSPAAIVGRYVEDGVIVLFSDIKVSASKMTVWRRAKEIMAGLTVPAVCVATPGSEKFLERLGWSYLCDSDEGAVYQWQV
jgi:hypothetical protein